MSAYKEKYGAHYVNTKKKTKEFLWKRDGRVCSWCIKSMKYPEATIDHIVPRSRGGTNLYANLQLLHRECNTEKGDK